MTGQIVELTEGQTPGRSIITLSQVGCQAVPGLFECKQYLRSLNYTWSPGRQSKIVSFFCKIQRLGKVYLSIPRRPIFDMSPRIMEG